MHITSQKLQGHMVPTRLLAAVETEEPHSWNESLRKDYASGGQFRLAVQLWRPMWMGQMHASLCVRYFLSQIPLSLVWHLGLVWHPIVAALIVPGSCPHLPEYTDCSSVQHLSSHGPLSLTFGVSVGFTFPTSYWPGFWLTCLSFHRPFLSLFPFCTLTISSLGVTPPGFQWIVLQCFYYQLSALMLLLLLQMPRLVPCGSYLHVYLPQGLCSHGI